MRNPGLFFIVYTTWDRTCSAFQYSDWPKVKILSQRFWAFTSDSPSYYYNNNINILLLLWLLYVNYFTTSRGDWFVGADPSGRADLSHQLSGECVPQATHCLCRRKGRGEIFFLGMKFLYDLLSPSRYEIRGNKWNN